MLVPMDFARLLKEINETMSMRAIADYCGLASAGHVHDIISGRQINVWYEPGAKIIELHKREKQKAKRQRK